MNETPQPNVPAGVQLRRACTVALEFGSCATTAGRKLNFPGKAQQPDRRRDEIEQY